MWSVSRSIFQRRQRKRGGDPCMEKWVMMSFSMVIDFHLRYSSSTFFFRLKRLSWGTLFCLKNAWKKVIHYELTCGFSFELSCDYSNVMMHLKNTSLSLCDGARQRLAWFFNLNAILKIAIKLPRSICLPKFLVIRYVGKERDNLTVVTGDLKKNYFPVHLYRRQWFHQRFKHWSSSRVQPPLVTPPPQCLCKLRQLQPSPMLLLEDSKGNSAALEVLPAINTEVAKNHYENKKSPAAAIYPYKIQRHQWCGQVV